MNWKMFFCFFSPLFCFFPQAQLFVDRGLYTRKIKIKIKIKISLSNLSNPGNLNSSCCMEPFCQNNIKNSII